LEEAQAREGREESFFHGPVSVVNFPEFYHTRRREFLYHRLSVKRCHQCGARGKIAKQERAAASPMTPIYKRGEADDEILDS
jgi:hypothetical protein